MMHSAYSPPWLLQHLRLLVVGLLTGVVALGFRRALEATETLRPQIMHVVGEGVLALLASIAFSIVAILPAVWLVAWWCPEASGSGIPQTKALARHPSPIRWLRLLLVKFASGVLGIGGGLALGREGPTVQSGASLGEMFASATHVSPGERRQLLILGAGAGLAGAFNAPLAGTLFIFEELGEEFRPSTCMSALLTTFSADLVCRTFTNQYPQIGTYPFQPPALDLLPFFLLLGWLGGVLGVIFNQSLLASLRLSRWLNTRSIGWILSLFVALLLGVLGWLNPNWVGGGDRILMQLHTGGLVLNVALFMLGMRFLLTIGSYAIGSAGGLFAPVLVLGGLMGCCVAETAQHPDRFALIVVGMASAFTGVVRTPVTGVLLMMEMAGAYALTVPLIGASLVAKMTADALYDRPIYEALLAAQQELKSESPR